MTVQEFKSEYPEYAHLEGDDLWNKMGDVVLMGSPGNQVLQQLKPIWKRYKLRYLFYRKVINFVYSKHSSIRCIHCKKDAQYSFILMDVDGKITRMHSCGSPWITENNINWDYRVWKFREAINKTFWSVLDKLHLVRSSSEGRYSMFGDEYQLVKRWSYNMNTGEISYKLKDRKWWEYIFIKL